MKELSIEEKAKRYDEILARAKGANIPYYKEDIMSKVKEFVDYLLPELKESEDEKIRKQIKMFIISHSRNESNNKIDSWLAWLEKQGEQKPVKSLIDYWKEMRLEVWAQASGNRSHNVSTDNTKMFSLNDIDEILEKIGDCQIEHKPEESKPKFKVGDWIINETSNFIYKVLSRGYEGYMVANVNKDKFTISLENEERYHLWTIQDAKDGDVLATLDYILIFKKILSKDGGVSYCHYDFGSSTPQFNFNKDDNWYFGKEAKVYPATKEQRDLLFQKMKEAGYEWDAEKKELKKIEQESTWNEEDEEYLKAAIWYAENPAPNVAKNAMLVEWVKNLKGRVLPQQKQEWSKEVEAAITLLKDIAEEQEKDYCPHNANNLRKAAQYLETCRPQSTWKPSEEQIISLQESIGIVGELTPRGELLKELAAQLKKLREK